jgi:hypothetical protein
MKPRENEIKQNEIEDNARGYERGRQRIRGTRTWRARPLNDYEHPGKLMVQKRRLTGKNGTSSPINAY